MRARSNVIEAVAAGAIVALGSGGLARADTLQVGAGGGQKYATPCAAVVAAQPNDEIDVAPGTYTDSCEINTPGLTIKGVGGRPTVDLSGTNHPADYKGIYVVSSDNVTIENMELKGAHVDDSEGGNAAAVRVSGHGVVIHGCYIHDNQNGVLAAPTVDGGTITIEYTELSHNGLGDACDHGGCVHNVYVSKESASVRYDKTVFQFNWSHDLASDTANKGHLLKSRSRATYVLYNRITGETGHDSYEVDIPNGGLGVVVGNAIEKGPAADNPTLLAYGEEGVDNPDESLYVVSNTFVNDFMSGTFISVPSGATLVAHDNIFFGPGTLSTAGSLSADNMTGIDPLFVDPSTYNYHLKPSSPAIGKAVAPGMAGTYSLIPAFEYVQPLLSVPRATDLDLGAFEHDTNTTGAGMDASVPLGSVEGGASGPDGATVPTEGGDGNASDGGVGAALEESGTGSSSGASPAAGSDAAAAAGGAGAPAVAPSTASSSGGCGCTVTDRPSEFGAGVVGWLSVLAWARRRRAARKARPFR